MINASDLQDELIRVLPPDLQSQVPTIASLLTQFIEQDRSTRKPEITTANNEILLQSLPLLAGKSLSIGSRLITFGDDAQFGEFQVRDVVGGSILNLTINLNSEHTSFNNRSSGSSVEDDKEIQHLQIILFEKRRYLGSLKKQFSEIQNDSENNEIKQKILETEAEASQIESRIRHRISQINRAKPIYSSNDIDVIYSHVAKIIRLEQAAKYLEMLLRINDEKKALYDSQDGLLVNNFVSSIIEGKGSSSSYLLKQALSLKSFRDILISIIGVTLGGFMLSLIFASIFPELAGIPFIISLIFILFIVIAFILFLFKQRRFDLDYTKFNEKLTMIERKTEELMGESVNAARTVVDELQKESDKERAKLEVYYKLNE
jgi:hypothetical protein